MPELYLRTSTPESTQALGRAVGEQNIAGDLIVLTGDLGAGKTEFVKGLAVGLGISENVVSPTFTIVREYVGRLALNHVDAYRLERVQEYLDLGLDELADSSVTVVEWGELVRDFLVADRLEAVLVFGAASDERMITLRSQGNEWANRLSALAPALKAFAAEVANP